jgi:hypothetical protein
MAGWMWGERFADFAAAVRDSMSGIMMMDDFADI